MSFEVEGNITCPYCSADMFVTDVVPASAWVPGGANWTGAINCGECEECVDYEGRVESSIENA